MAVTVKRGYRPVGKLCFRMIPGDQFASTNVNTCEFVGDTCHLGNH